MSDLIDFLRKHEDDIAQKESDNEFTVLSELFIKMIGRKPQKIRLEGICTRCACSMEYKGNIGDCKLYQCLADGNIELFYIKDK